jgi:hypothetical protein
MQASQACFKSTAPKPFSSNHPSAHSLHPAVTAKDKGKLTSASSFLDLTSLDFLPPRNHQGTGQSKRFTYHEPATACIRQKKKLRPRYEMLHMTRYTD